MGNAESQPCRNVDKRTARRDHAPKFVSSISAYRYDNGLLGEDAHEAAYGYENGLLGEDAHGQPSGGVGDRGGSDSGEGTSRLRVCVRQRPIFSHETQAGEFDVLSSDTRAMVVHDCRMEADCRRLFISHHTLAFDRVFDGDPNPNPYPNPNPNPIPNPKP